MVALRSLVAILLLVGCGRIGFDHGATGDAVLLDDAPMIDAIVMGGFTHRKAIAITSSDTVVNFPVSISAADVDLAAVARADGSDLVFTDENGAVLPFEIVRYGAGAIDAWVRVPSLTGGVPATIYLYYGGDPVVHDATAAWAGTAGIWHMTDGTAFNDSASGAHHIAVPQATRRPQMVTGIAGTACLFDGIDDGGSIARPIDNSLEMGVSSFTISLWVIVTTSFGAYDMPLRHGGSATSLPGYDVELGQQNWSAGIADGTRIVADAFGDELQFIDVWTHVTAVVDRTANAIYFYTNGVMVNAQDLTGVGSIDTIAGTDFSIGDPTYPFEGVLDEVHIYRSALSAARIHAAYANLAMRASFIAFGPEETL